MRVRLKVSYLFIRITSVLGKQCKRCCYVNFTSLVFLNTLSISAKLVHDVNNLANSQGEHDANVIYP